MCFGEGSFRSDHVLSGRSLFSLSCQSSEECLSSLFQGANPTAANSALYSTFLTSPRVGAVFMAIESPSSSPVSAKTDEVAFLEAARALRCASGFILAEIASNQCTKLFIGRVPVPSVLLASPPVIACLRCNSSASLQVSGGTSFDAAPASNGFEVTMGFDFGFSLVCWTGDVTRYWLGPNTLCGIDECPGHLSFDTGISHSKMVIILLIRSLIFGGSTPIAPGRSL